MGQAHLPTKSTQHMCEQWFPKQGGDRSQDTKTLHMRHQHHWWACATCHALDAQDKSLHQEKKDVYIAIYSQCSSPSSIYCPLIYSTR